MTRCIKAISWNEIPLTSPSASASVGRGYHRISGWVKTKAQTAESWGRSGASGQLQGPPAHVQAQPRSRIFDFDFRVQQFSAPGGFTRHRVRKTCEGRTSAHCLLRPPARTESACLRGPHKAGPSLVCLNDDRLVITSGGTPLEQPLDSLSHSILDQLSRAVIAKDTARFSHDLLLRRTNVLS
jgi:hypothetical protein